MTATRTAAPAGSLVGYARVSTSDQHAEAQTDALAAVGCARTFTDHASGKLATRPALTELLDYVRPGDTVVITKLDRLGRSVRNLIDLVAEFDSRGVGLRVLDQGIDTSTPGGRMFFHVIAAMGQFEADMISERTRDGLAAARVRGQVGGRKRVLTSGKLATARRLVDEGEHTMAQVAEIVGCSRATLYRALSTGGAEAPIEA